MKRFYRTAAVTEAGAGFAVLLDGKPMQTPGKARLDLPKHALAEAIAAEWRGQGEELRPSALPLTRLASTAIDVVQPRRKAVIAELANYAATELLCYRAEHPPELALRQRKAWQPLLDWAALRYDAPLRIGAGVLPFAQPPDSLRALAVAIEAHDAMALAALNLAIRASGSLIIGLALIEERLDAGAAFAAAELDESFEIEQWGEDAEQTRRRAGLKDDLAAAARFMALLRA
jgi:chaperone required for assembly of F1-ATPase